MKPFNFVLKQVVLGVLGGGMMALKIERASRKFKLRRWGWEVPWTFSNICEFFRQS
jgi:hypothetical protein